MAREAQKVPKILVLGGIKSGKSAFALRLGNTYPPPRVFLATAEAFDQEMAQKIRAHQEERGAAWQTIESPVELPTALENIPRAGVCLIDCLTVWLGNLWYYQKDHQAYVERLLGALEKTSWPTILVSNEVGLGLMPGEKESRAFAEALGRLNQEVAHLCTEVYLVVAGVPVRIK